LDVKNLAKQGFPLDGGRVDYLDDRRVATLVYHRNDHIINLYVWPADGKADTQPAVQSRHNFNLIHWVHSEMNYWAISDLNKNELMEFADLVGHP
jgi:anti-sigma factor RsiW